MLITLLRMYIRASTYVARIATNSINVKKNVKKQDNRSTRWTDRKEEKTQ